MAEQKALDVTMRALTRSALEADKRVVRLAGKAVQVERVLRLAEERASRFDEELVRALDELGGTWIDHESRQRFTLCGDIRGWRSERVADVRLLTG